MAHEMYNLFFKGNSLLPIIFVLCPMWNIHVEIENILREERSNILYVGTSKF